MLSVQVDYWKLQESKRHNLAEEAIEREKNQQGWYNTSANLYTASANLQNASSNARNATSNERNVEVNRENAESNRITALANKQNADTNVRNADINYMNAITNQRNAESNARNAASNERNASSNEKNAQSNALKASADWAQAEYNTRGVGKFKDQAEISLINAQRETQKSQKAYNEAVTQTENEGRNAKIAGSIRSPYAAGVYLGLEGRDFVADTAPGVKKWFENIFDDGVDYGSRQVDPSSGPPRG